MKREKVLETILVLVLAAVFFSWWFNNNYLLGIAFILGGIGLFIPWLAGKIHWCWDKFSYYLGQVMSKVILTVIYVVVLLPLALFVKLTGKSGIRVKAGQSSYFTERNVEYDKESMEKMW